MINDPNFQFKKHLGQGGYGKVELYYQKDKTRLVAIKTLTNPQDPVAQARFTQEIEIATKLKDHSNTINILFRQKSSTPQYYGMTYYPEGTLKDLLAKKGKFTIDESLELIRKLAKTLKSIHKRNIIHRDLKPSNIFLSSGEPILGDWGLGKPTDKRSNTITQNQGIGTQVYCAPEQLYGGKSDHKSDIFSLGIIFNELLTGDPEGDFKGYNLPNIIKKMIARFPENRHKNMQEFLYDIRIVRENRSILRFGKKIFGYTPEIALAATTGYGIYQVFKEQNQETKT